MPIQTECRCGRSIRVRDELEGKKIRCPDCGKVVVVRAANRPRTQRQQPQRTKRKRRPVTAAAAPETEIALPPKRRRKKSPARRPSESNGTGRWSVVGLVLLGIVGFAVKLYNRWDRLFPPEPVAVADVSGLDSSGLNRPLFDPGMNPLPAQPAKVTQQSALDDAFSLTAIPLPVFPELSTASLQLSGVSIHEVKLNGPSHIPGANTHLRIYIPQNAASDHSRGCVLVAPAGSNLLVGMEIDGSDYHDETLPYALDGNVVIMYSLDGGRDLDVGNDALIMRNLQAGYREFTAARAGLVNARNALEFVLAKLPQVHPRKIYSAGHSSGGTLSLLLAATQPKLAGAIAYAPVSDLRVRLGELAADREIVSLLPGLSSYLKQYSPITHASEMIRPLFLFHAADDSNVSIADSHALADVIRKHGTLDYTVAPSGNHYQSMIDRGIPAAREWLKRQAATP